MIHLFGIRHHGPGCARSLVTALQELQPDALLIEGPPDATSLLPFVGHEELVPPVALLIYPEDQPAQGVFYPLAEFSPEWQALRFANERQLPIRLLDLPLAHRLRLADQVADQEPHWLQLDEELRVLREDPLGVLAQVAGYTDRELWWDHLVEQRLDGTDLFAAITEAMIALRTPIRTAEVAALPPLGQRKPTTEELREAWMRQTIRSMLQFGYRRIAVVTGAWHVPALLGLDNTAAATATTESPANYDPAVATWLTESRQTDSALLQHLPHTKTAATWIPWSYSRLAQRSGYGAGVSSPGWYDHLWQSADRAIVRWATRAAQLFRQADLNASVAEVIESVRLAETLASLRDLPMAGLPEIRDALQSVFGLQHHNAYGLIRERLEIDDRFGSVPATVPAVALQRDLQQWQRRLRLTPQTNTVEKVLDLRQELDRERSQLLHRLQLLDIPWGQPVESRGLGTFKETWKLRWQPEFALQLVQASIFGNTIASAAEESLFQQLRQRLPLTERIQRLDTVLAAHLPAALRALLKTIQQEGVVANDLLDLMRSIPLLLRSATFGNVRQTPLEQLQEVVHGLFERVVIGLVKCVQGSDALVASDFAQAMQGLQRGCQLVEHQLPMAHWYACLHQLVQASAIPPRIRGTSVRLLFDDKQISTADLEQATAFALSGRESLLERAQWIQGLFLSTETEKSPTNLALTSSKGLWRALHQWLSQLSEEPFLFVLPLLRRCFVTFEPSIRRQVAEQVKLLCVPPIGASKTAAEFEILPTPAKPTDTAEPTSPVQSPWPEATFARFQTLRPILCQITGGTMQPSRAVDSEGNQTM